MNPPPCTPEQLATLREQVLARCDTEEELRTLCADLGVNYDDLPVMGRANKARELVAFLERRNRLPELPTILARPRPAKIRPAQQRALRNRQAMLQLVHNFWVKGVLEQSLHGAAIIALGMTEQAGAVEHPWDMVLQAPDVPDRALPPDTQMINTFDEMNHALLILGEPGSGKTTMLLELARDTIARAEQDPSQPIPVVFNLSSWAEKRQPLVEWLVEELNIKYNIPKKIAKPWVEKDELLLLLDGLDEVKLEVREACVQAINEFRQEHGLVPLAVCSRRADYEALTTRLKLQGAVRLQPLTPEQIDRYLAGMGDELVEVHSALGHDPTLQELAQSPLTLSIMALAYRGASVQDLAPGTTEARRKHLFDAYLQQMFKRRGANQHYSQKQTRRWLTWLAEKMMQHGQTEFHTEEMQPDWLTAQWQRWAYTLISRTIVGLAIGLALVPMGKVFGVNFGGDIGSQTGGLVGALLGSLLALLMGGTGGLLVGVMDGIRLGRSKYAETESTPSPGHRVAEHIPVVGLIVGSVNALILGAVAGLASRSSVQGWLASFALGAVYGLILGMIFEIVMGARGQRPTIRADVKAVESISWSWRESWQVAMPGLIVGTVFGAIIKLLFGKELELSACLLIGAFIGGVSGMVLGGLRGRQIADKTYPDQGIWSSATNAVSVGVIVGLCLGTAIGITDVLASQQSAKPLGGLIKDLTNWGIPFNLTTWGILIGVVAMLRYGAVEVIKHVTLRFLLWRKQWLAWNYAHFLDYAAERIFLHKVGGGYIFVHRTLMEYFASLNQPQVKPE